MNIKFQPNTIVLCLLCCLAACSEQPAGKNDADLASNVKEIKNHSALLQQIDTANDICRGKPGDSKEGIEACDKRERLMGEAEKLGICWGPQDAFGAEKHWIRCSDDPAYVKPWYSHDLNHAHCIESGSPADKMRMITGMGKKPKVLDLPNGAVEVHDEIGNGKTVVWTFYSSMDSCNKTLPRAIVIDKKYE